MSADRELLESAAKAGGINASWLDPDDDAVGAEGMFLNGERSPDNSKFWNPRRDDGDAFRLLLSAGLSLQVSYGDKELAYVEVHRYAEPCVSFELSGWDARDVAREAVTEAAARVGRALRQSNAEPTPVQEAAQRVAEAIALERDRVLRDALNKALGRIDWTPDELVGRCTEHLGAHYLDGRLLVRFGTPVFDRVGDHLTYHLPVECFV